MQKEKVSFKEINRLAIPAIFSGIVEPLISLTDTAVAGRLPTHAAEALGAIGFVGSFLSALIWIFLQTSSAISALVSHSYGEGNIEKLKALVSQLFFFNLAVSILLSVLSFFLAEWIFTLYNAQGVLLETAVDYFRIRVWGYPLTLLTFTIFGVFRGMQNTSWAMLISIVGGVLNVVLDVLLVFVFDFHVEGIAWASLTAQSLMFLLALIYLYKKTPFRLMRLFPLHEDLGKTLRMSFDLFLRTLALNIAMFLAYRFANDLGGRENNQFVGAHALLLQLWLFASFLLDGYAHAGAAISGKLYGAREFTKLHYLVKDLVKTMLAIGITLGLVYFLFYYQIGGLLTKSADVLNIFFAVFWIVAIMQPINSIAFLFDGIYKGLGETKVLRNVFIIALIVGFVPAMYLFQYFELGVEGIWWSFFIWMIFRGGGLILHYFKHYAVKAQSSQ